MAQTLTDAQKRIVREIWRLHSRNEPLNISAVKRRHPEIMRAVYEVKPYWGWRAALRDAGLDYGVIRQELLDTVVCHVCGKELGGLGSHLQRIHEMTGEEYLEEYPGSELVTEMFRAALTVNLRRIPTMGVRHWEKVWSREYVLDYLAELHKRGILLHCRLHPTLKTAWRNHVPSWEEAVQIVVARTYLKMGRYPTKDLVRRAILERRERGLPIESVAVSKGKQHDSALYKTAYRLYGDWRSAVRAAGIDYRWGAYATPAEVIREIRRRRKAGLSLNTFQLQSGRHRDHPLYHAGAKFFGSWYAAIKKAGIRGIVPLKAPLPRYPNPESVLTSIRRRKRRKLSLYSRAILAQDAALYFSARKFFGTMTRALLAANIGWRGRGAYATRELVIAEVQRRLRRGMGCTSTAVRCGKRAEPRLRDSAVRLFGSWDAALRAAGVTSAG